MTLPGYSALGMTQAHGNRYKDAHVHIEGRGRLLDFLILFSYPQKAQAGQAALPVGLQ